MNFKAGLLSMSLPITVEWVWTLNSILYYYSFLTAKILNEKTLKKQQVVNLQYYERRRPPSPLAELSPPPFPQIKSQNIKQ